MLNVPPSYDPSEAFYVILFEDDYVHNTHTELLIKATTTTYSYNFLGEVLIMIRVL